MLNRVILFLLAAGLSACAHSPVDKQFTRNYGGNSLEVAVSRIGEAGEQKYSAVITKKTEGWTGALKGGEAKLPSRKKFLLEAAENQAKLTCKPRKYTSEDPQYIMLNTSPEFLGRGIFAHILTSLAPEYENMPQGINYNFQCINPPSLHAG